MRIERIECENTEFLLNRLKGQVFHLTTQEAYSSVLEAGEISNNKSEQFSLNTSSQCSYGRLHGYVCLFDLRDDSPDIIQKTLDCYNFIGPSWFEKVNDENSTWDIVYLLLNAKYYDRIIPNTAAHDYYSKTGKPPHLIPKTEVWIEDHLPLDWIDTALIVTIKHTPDLSTYAGCLAWAVRKSSRLMGKSGEIEG